MALLTLEPWKSRNNIDDQNIENESWFIARSQKMVKISFWLFIWHYFGSLTVRVLFWSYLVHKPQTHPQEHITISQLHNFLRKNKTTSHNLRQTSANFFESFYEIQHCPDQSLEVRQLATLPLSWSTTAVTTSNYINHNHWTHYKLESWVSQMESQRSLRRGISVSHPHALDLFLFQMRSNIVYWKNQND